MVDSTSIIVAVLALAGAIAAAVLTGWTTFYSDERRRLSETEKLVAKYSGPLVLAANDLQSRLYSITETRDPLTWRDSNDRERNNLYRYTCFLVGRYLSWTYIFRHQAQFLYMRGKKGNKLVETMDMIEFTFSVTMQSTGIPFCLWRGEQMAIGELMSYKEEGEQFCLGYSKFITYWDDDSRDIQLWFQSLMRDIDTLADAFCQSQNQHPWVPVPDQRLRQLQHLLIELISILDPHKLQFDRTRNKRCAAATTCPCSHCMSRADQMPTTPTPLPAHSNTTAHQQFALECKKCKHLNLKMQGP
ncbi:hypothetical protein BGZ99_000628 [Dissophora globulifera]|uniref:Uncharacterized protein n=1 Tax=Dissophora globulifera TaxID=979702 RepID=A0A9P6ULE2_9FUNG|nr:hypothetical protein BGZ99_000628 [Dissophora globulifera]